MPKFAEVLADIERTNDLLPPTRLESHSRNLRNANKISQLRFRTSRFKNSPIPHFIELLNKYYWFFNFDFPACIFLCLYVQQFLCDFISFFCVCGGGDLELEWNVGFVCVNVNDVSGWVFAGECMCMSLFEFAYLGFEEERESLVIFWGFFSQCLGYFY